MTGHVDSYQRNPDITLQNSDVLVVTPDNRLLQSDKMIYSGTRQYILQTISLCFIHHEVNWFL
jgi:hypothetical protein